MIEIKQITNREDPVLSLVIQWLWDWWGKEEGYTTTQVDAYVRHAACTDRVPQLFCVYENNQPIGTFQLAMADLDTRPDLYPWLRDVYLLPEYRGKGILKEIMAVVRRQMAALDLKELYLFTVHQGLYEKYGWELAEILPTDLLPAPADGPQRLYRLRKI
ncbi:GNAT family N-acetyltransferase [Anaerotignum lactatifermentans]|uniref:GNAT family N-acetyltransferase n=1 Tax=Anaerotignum lactatifermentans TaxID=160404 RepID=A0ABS2GA88_9FIRM|nr:GNAT family N-acetyltransferase [Anaerotignum lactatifermentans]MBM6829330.1 GNAT family N-acetyltransferase [Anaerotignum lactatifermentans]MBM6877429.1 GNAT family N-acetyltransferase [Anaerotignum lactatifermentans]MBM6950907.1 GNAT family N-acetyltransferase [Anaerotignum lactatifermentans]